MSQGMEPSGAEGGFSGAIDSSSFGSCSPSLAHDADEVMSASSWTSPARWKEGDWIERTCDHVIAWHSLRRNISQMKVVVDFESRPHKAVSFVVERDKEVQEWNEQKPKVLPGYSGGRLPGRSAVEAGGEEEGQQEEKGQRNIRHETPKEEVEKKRRQRRHAERNKSEMKSF